MIFKFKDVIALSNIFINLQKKCGKTLKTEHYKIQTNEIFKPHRKRKVACFDEKYKKWCVCDYYFPNEFIRDLFLFEVKLGYISLVKGIL